MSGPGYYRHSGQYPPAGLVLGGLASLVAAVALAFAYAYGTLYSPLVRLTFIISIGYGLAVGWLTATILKSQRVRNTPLVLGATVLVLLAGYYASWVVWIHAYFVRSDPDLTLAVVLENPAALWRAIEIVNENGAHSYGHAGASPTGVFLWAIWAIELGLVFAGAIYTARKISDAAPFCETCGAFCPEERPRASVALCHRTRLAAKMEAKELAFLDEQGLPRGRSPAWLEVGLHACPSCADTATLTLRQATRGAGGRVARRTVVDKLVLTAAEAETIRGLGKRLVSDARARAKAAAPAPPPKKGPPPKAR